MNQKDQRIKKLYEKGMDVSQIARKIGYSPGNLQAGIERVQEGIKRITQYQRQKEEFGIEMTPSDAQLLGQTMKAV